MVSCYVGRHVDWDILLQNFSYAMNAAGYTPSYLNAGRDLRLPSVLGAKDNTLLEHTLPKNWADNVSKLKEN
jgi:hypothetical protein